MPYATESEIKDAVARALRLSSASLLPESWDGIVTDATERAKQDIQQILVERGFSNSQIESWVSLASNHKLQAMYWALVMGVGLHTTDDKWVNKLDQREYLKTTPVNLPGGDSPGPAGIPPIIEVGQLKTENDRWQMGNKDDDWTGTTW